jgi:hypothetical protein
VNEARARQLEVQAQEIDKASGRRRRPDGCRRTALVEARVREAEQARMQMAAAQLRRPRSPKNCPS